MKHEKSAPFAGILSLYCILHEEARLCKQKFRIFAVRRPPLTVPRPPYTAPRSFRRRFLQGERKLSRFCRRNVFSDKIRANRKLRMPPVDKHRKLNPRRTTQSHYRIERSPCRSAGINNIIHKDNRFSDKRKIHFRRAYHGVGRNSRKIVAVKGYVKFADGNFCAGYPFDVFRKAERKRNAASADPDKTYAVRAVVFSII